MSGANFKAELFSKYYLRLIKNAGIEGYSLWVSEMEENSFPQLPVFQDKNLLVAIGFYKNEAEYYAKQKQMEVSDNAELKDKMMDTITTKSTLIIYPT
ncbi:MAG: hypothetical protein M3Z92_15075 [Bacteroidota bacterium]|nr:hypothetical protein [Bacteroidota bacterium]